MKLCWGQSLNKTVAWSCNYARLRLGSAEKSECFMILWNVCIGCSSLMRVQALSYRGSLNALLGHAQLRGEYFGGYRAYVVRMFTLFILQVTITLRSAGVIPLHWKVMVRSSRYPLRLARPSFSRSFVILFFAFHLKCVFC